jgi:hypothetical protein
MCGLKIIGYVQGQENQNGTIPVTPDKFKGNPHVWEKP